MKKQNKLRMFKRKEPASKKLLGAKINNSDYQKKYDDMIDYGTGKKRSRKIKKVLLIILCVILALAIVIGSVFAYLYYNGKGQFADAEANLNIPEKLTEDDGNTVKVDGTTYVYDEDVTTILLMGIDKDEQTQIKTDEVGTSGQADALYLACIDNKDKKYTILSINRDSMVDVDVYSTKGEYIGIKKMQACLSYAYGDGKEKSCENTSKAISRLLYNIPINSYFSINKASISLLNDIVDGVDVPVYDSEGNATTEITHLEGQEAYDYIHYRDTKKLDSNLARIKRQTSYIKAFASKVIARTKSNLGTPLELFETVSIYSTTDLNASKITYLTTNAFSDRNDINIEFKSVPGKVVEGEGGYAEYEVDTDGLLQVVLDIFYDKVEEEPTSAK